MMPTFSAFRGTGGLYFDFVGFSQSNILPYVGGGFGFAIRWNSMVMISMTTRWA